ncbi:hypothetical protein JHK82_016107 [Glycine max]|nr:hypothetical protein JHK85_016504 [Glycine max]KAG5046727.1 hypothetical protein JHK86_016133 [Glycine max]KAG5149226.1 hypothetical protein JHK82_016107 [Glycine max]
METMRSLKIKTRMEEWKKKKEGRCKAFGWFKTHVLDSKLEIGINHQELCSLLSLGGKAKDSHISLLIMADILCRADLRYVSLPLLLQLLLLGSSVVVTIVSFHWHHRPPRVEPPSFHSAV